MSSRKIQLAHQAMMLNDANQLLAINRQQLKSHGRMMCDLPQLDEEPMGIHIGDVNVQPPPAPARNGSIMKMVIEAGLGAALLATGAGGAFGLAALLRPVALAPAVPIDIEIPWEWKDGKMQFGSPQSTEPDLTIPVKR